jgi:hypothetical protein
MLARRVEPELRACWVRDSACLPCRASGFSQPSSAASGHRPDEPLMGPSLEKVWLWFHEYP